MSSNFIQVSWDDRHKILFSKLNSIRRKGLHCDMTLFCDGKKFPVHRLILQMSSGYFAKTFEDHKDQDIPRTVWICGIKSPILQSLLDFIYNGKATVKEADIIYLINAGIMLEVPGLMESGSDFTNPDVERNGIESKTNATFSDVQSQFSKSYDDTMPDPETSQGEIVPAIISKSRNIIEKKNSVEDNNELVNSDLIHIVSKEKRSSYITNNQSKRSGVLNTKKKVEIVSDNSPSKIFISDPSSAEEWEGWEEKDIQKNKRNKIKTGVFTAKGSHVQSSSKHLYPISKVTMKGRKRTYCCHICKRSYFKNESLAQHILSHNDSNTFTCNICHKHFTNKRSFDSHGSTHKHSLEYFDRTSNQLINSGANQETQSSYNVNSISFSENKRRKLYESNMSDRAIDDVLESVSESFKDISSDVCIIDDSIFDSELPENTFETTNLSTDREKYSLCENKNIPNQDSERIFITNLKDSMHWQF